MKFLRRFASQAAAQHLKYSGYVATKCSSLFSPLGPHAAGNLVPLPEPFTRFTSYRGTEVHASFEDILVVGKAFRLFVTSPTRFPRRWKMLPKYDELMRGFPGPCCVARWNDQLLLLLTASGNEASLLYSFHSNSWIRCEQPRRVYPGMSELSHPAAWFQGSFYLKCRDLLAAQELYEASGAPDPGPDDDDEVLEPDPYSMMRFDSGERRWHQLELSAADAELLSSGMPNTLVLRGQLLIFSVAWKYLIETSGDISLENYYVGEERAEALWDGRSNPFKVFRLEDDATRPGWSEASESRRKNMKKLVDVSREFAKLLDTAWERKAGRFLSGVDASYGDDVLFWITFNATAERYHVSRDELVGPPGRFLGGQEGGYYTHRSLPELLHLVHRDPGGEASLFELFEGLPEINDSTSDDELRRLFPHSEFREKQLINFSLGELTPSFL